MSPEEILLSGFAPLNRAVDTLNQGNTDFAKLRYLQAYKSAEDDKDFARQAQAARDLLKLRLSGEGEMWAKRDATQLEKQRIIEGERDKRYIDAGKEAEARQIGRENNHTINAIKNLHAQAGIQSAPRNGMSDEDYINALNSQTAIHRHDKVETLSDNLVALNEAIEQKQNPENDPSKTAILQNNVAVSSPAAFLAYLDGNGYTDQAKKIRKGLEKGDKSFDMVVQGAMGTHGKGLLASIRMQLKYQLASSMVTKEDRDYLDSLYKQVAQYHNDPDVFARAAEKAGTKLLADRQRVVSGLPAPGTVSATPPGARAQAIIAPQPGSPQWTGVIPSFTRKVFGSDPVGAVGDASGVLAQNIISGFGDVGRTLFTGAPIVPQVGLRDVNRARYSEAPVDASYGALPLRTNQVPPHLIFQIPEASDADQIGPASHPAYDVPADNPNAVFAQ